MSNEEAAYMPYSPEMDQQRAAEEAQIIDGLAAGLFQTEGALAALSEAMEAGAKAVDEFTSASIAADYTAQLERAVLWMWPGDISCLLCQSPDGGYQTHAPDCIVPALEAKYPDGA